METTEKEQKTQELRKQCDINNSLANLNKDILSIETQLKVYSTVFDEELGIKTICDENIPKIEKLRRDIAQYLACN